MEHLEALLIGRTKERGMNSVDALWVEAINVHNRVPPPVTQAPKVTAMGDTIVRQFQG